MPVSPPAAARRHGLITGPARIRELERENERLRLALMRARDDLLILGESDELLAPAVERIDAALAQ